MYKTLLLLWKEIAEEDSEKEIEKLDEGDDGKAGPETRGAAQAGQQLDRVHGCHLDHRLAVQLLEVVCSLLCHLTGHRWALSRHHHHDLLSSSHCRQRHHSRHRRLVRHLIED